MTRAWSAASERPSFQEICLVLDHFCPTEAEAAWLDEPSGHPLDPVKQPTDRTGPIFTNCDDLMSPESSECGSSTVDVPVVDAAQGSRESTTKRAGGGEFVPAGPADVPEDMWEFLPLDEVKTFAVFCCGAEERPSPPTQTAHAVQRELCLGRCP